MKRTRSRRKYRTRKHVEQAAAYLNTYGKQRDRYEWVIGQHVDDPECFELFTVPREPDAARVGTATQPQR